MFQVWHWTEGWVGPSANLYVAAKRKMLPYWELKPSCPATAYQYTDWVTPAGKTNENEHADLEITHVP
jgi:hypothetical protein